jgi:hypothetical protein
MRRLTAAAVLFCWFSPSAPGQLPPARADEPKDAAETPVAAERLEVMTAHAADIQFRAAVAGFPNRLEKKPLFRYDDETRGYIDGTVWRLGAKGRPLAIVTTELHPNYLGGGPRVVYDALSLSSNPFSANLGKYVWTPPGSAVEMKPLPKGPAPAATEALRLTQMKELSRRFTASQEIQETDRTLVQLRRLPREIDRYKPTEAEKADGALFLFSNGRNPGLILFIETDGTAWQYGCGRLSAPSTLTLLLDDLAVWSEPPSGLGSNSPYTATNQPAEFP